MARKKIVTPESDSNDTDWDGQDSEDQATDDTQESTAEDVTRESVSEEEVSDNTASEASSVEDSDEETSEEEPVVSSRTTKSAHPRTTKSAHPRLRQEPLPKKKSRPSTPSESDEESDEEFDEESDEEPIPRKIISKRSQHLSAPERISRTKDSNEIFKELIKNQIPNVPAKWKLNINDMKRICKYVDRSIFDPDVCCLWKGYITNMNNLSKGTYVNFYFRNKKVALHRLLYSNFVAPLDETEYLKFNCEHKGVCCNVHHYERYRYSKNSSFTKEPKKEPKKESKDSFVIGTDDPTKLIIDFD